jgi:hypothetical protein
MLRLLGFATLFLVAICLVVSVSIALADGRVTPAAAAPQGQTRSGRSRSERDR